jgi:hypothetical protein
MTLIPMELRPPYNHNRTWYLKNKYYQGSVHASGTRITYLESLGLVHLVTGMVGPDSPGSDDPSPKGSVGLERVEIEELIVCLTYILEDIKKKEKE